MLCTRIDGDDNKYDDIEEDEDDMFAIVVCLMRCTG